MVTTRMEVTVTTCSVVMVVIWAPAGVVIAGPVAFALEASATREVEALETSDTGQMVVPMVTTSVTRAVDTAPGGRAEMAAVSPAAGQLVTVGAHEITVRTEVCLTVSVVN